MGSTFIAGQALAFANDDTVSADTQQNVRQAEFSDANGKVDLTDIKLSNLSPQVMQNDQTAELSNQKGTLIVSLSGSALEDVKDNTARAQLQSEHNSFLKELKRAGVSYELKHEYYAALNGVAIEADLSAYQTICGMDGVSSAFVGSTYERPKEIDVSDGAQTNYSSIYKNGIYDSSKYINADPDNPERGVYDGSGMSVAILDTGLDYTHAAFQGDGLDTAATAFKRSDIEEKMSQTTFAATVRSGATANDVWISDKVPFAYDYADSDSNVYPSYSQHGTHVAGIVAGKDDHYDDKDGNRVDEPFRGVAPEAQLVICKVFTDDLEDEALGGAETEDILAALEDCINLNVDVINMSLGTSCGFSSDSLGIRGDEEGKSMKKVYSEIRKRGITLMVAASNEYSAAYGGAFGTNLASNPDSGTIGSPSTFEGAMSVASINGQYSPYLLANAKQENGVYTGDAIYYEESRNEDSDAYNFVNELLGDPDSPNAKETETFGYVVIPGVGEPGDYTSPVMRAINQFKSEGTRWLAVIRRGTTNFSAKIKTAYDKEADGVIVYNNVSGMIRMSLGDMKVHIPAVSVSMAAGLTLTGEGSSRKSVGTITLHRDFTAGPFMNDYSSWGTTPDLQLKPDVTSHGGEITSTVSGGYAEMSGTSMACPNLAGFTALVKSYVKDKFALDGVALTKLTNNLIMSTATTVYDQNKLPYSPRKQGAGLATLDNVFNTKAYLYTKDTEDKSDAEYMCEDGRPKAELGDDPERKGEYSITFYVKNFGASDLQFKTNSIFFTETLGKDGKSVAEMAHLFNSKSEWTVDNRAVAEGEKITVAGGQAAKITVKLSMSAEDKKYLDPKTSKFVNGMFVEGFIQLKGEGGQCDLNLPFMGFYGDWKSAPMLDLDCYEVAKDAKDTSLKPEERRQASVWATQAYSYYWNEKYVLPIGSFIYKQDEAKEHTADYVYTDVEHGAISKFNEYHGENSYDNYMTATGIKALYAGLLRNAELVAYTLKNEDTGEIIPDANGNKVREIYRVPKAYSGGGSSRPAQVLMELRNDELGLEGNGKYSLEFEFYFDYKDFEEGKGTDDKFSMTFYVDYEAPILVDSRIRYQDRKDSNGKDIQKVYLDLDVFDNHYPQAVLLSYLDGEADTDGVNRVKLATEYITPIINPAKNTVNTISLDITDLYEDYKDEFYVELDDYALNSNVYKIDLSHSRTDAVCPSEFEITHNGQAIEEITITKNQAVKLGISGLGNANVSNFNWRSERASVVSVKNGEIFGLREGTATIIAEGGLVSNGTSSYNATKRLIVKVVGESELKAVPTIKFGTMKNSDDIPVAASGFVKVNPAQQIKLNIVADPWYYPVDNINFVWKSSDDTLATVDQNGNVSILYEGEDAKTVTISVQGEGDFQSCRTEVSFMIQDPFKITDGNLTRYRGWGGELINGKRVLTVPTSKSIMTIDDEAFKDNEHLQVVVIPKSVTSIGENAFQNCTSLEKVCFVSEDKLQVAQSSLNLIHRYAFNGCTNLTTLDLSNCKVITLDRNVFNGCTKLSEIVKWEAIGTMGAQTFMGCTSLEEAYITGLHSASYQVFMGCTALNTVTMGKDTQLGYGMFQGCTGLQQVTINCKTIPAYAFFDCENLTTVSLGCDIETIGEYAFARCGKLTTLDTQAHSIAAIGDFAFANCTMLSHDFFDGMATKPTLGNDVFHSVSSISSEVVSNGVLVRAANSVSSSSLTGGVTAIGSYAYSGSTLSGVNTIDLTGVTAIGEGAFANLKGLESVTIPEGITKIPALAFYGTGLKSITIPAGVTEIGDGAFGNCTALKQVIFAGNQLTTLGVSAFSGSGLTSVSLPASVTTVGTEAFAECAKLKTVTLPSVTSMGEGVFAYCPELTSAEFGENATVTGTYTFFAGNNSASKLTSVTFRGTIDKIDTGVFAYCTELQSIDLTGVEEIHDKAFFECSKLASVTGLEGVKVIGANAFAYCALQDVDLSAAEVISYRAFLENTELQTVKFGNSLQGIGDEAFIKTALAKVDLPASCNFVGVSAFRAVTALEKFTVASDSKYYFADEYGVLYRYVDKDKSSFELVSFPYDCALTATDTVLTYRIKEGTLSVLAFAFGSVPATTVKKVIFPHTLKILGSNAFNQSGVSVYEFECIQAPTLLERVAIVTSLEDGATIPNRVLDRNTNYAANSFYYDNFNGLFADAVSQYFPGQEGINADAVSEITLRYPSNGVGYANFVYSNYFGTKQITTEMPEPASYQLVEILKTLPSVETVKGWTTGNTTKSDVEVVAESVKSAHILYNGLKTDAQKDWINGQQVSLDTIFELEAALKPLKKAFGISVRVTTVRVDASSAHKTQYLTGEKFTLNGLKLLITYDDYSQEIIDAAQGFTIEERYSGVALQPIDEAVTLNGFGDYSGKMVSVRIYVTDSAAGGNGGGISNGATTAIIVVSVVAALAIAAVVTVVILIKKGVIKVKNKKENSSEDNDGDADSEVSAESETEGYKQIDEENVAAEQTEATEEESEALENGENEQEDGNHTDD